MNGTKVYAVTNAVGTMLQKYLCIICNVFVNMYMALKEVSVTVKSFFNSKLKTIKLAITLHKTIRRMGMKITSFYRENNQIIFTYKTGARHPFDYGELIALQQIIEPEQVISDETRYPTPWGYHGEYTLYIDIPIWAS